MLLTPRNESIGIELYITVPWKSEAFSALQTQKAAIEAELGSALQWMPLPGKKSARVLLEGKIDPRKPENEPQVREWFAVNSVKMFKAFKNRVRGLLEPSEREGAFGSGTMAPTPAIAESDDGQEFPD